MKRCTKCGETKPLDDFYRNRQSRDGRFAWCSACASESNRRWRERNREDRAEYMRRYRKENADAVREANRRWREQNPETLRRWVLAKYQLTPESFEALLASQGGACRLCKTTEPGARGWNIDHDHSCCPSGKSIKTPTCGKCTRGILCPTCNQALGMFGDDPARLRLAADYIELKEKMG